MSEEAEAESPNEAPEGESMVGGGEGLDLDLSKFKIYYNVAVGGKRVIVYTDIEKIKAWLWIIPVSQYFEISYKEIEAALESTRLAVSQAKMAQVNEYLQQLRSRDEKAEIDPSEFKPMLIAEGKAAIDGVNGWLEWYIDEPDPKRLRFQEDAHGKIDFREMNRVINVNTDDPLVMLHEPTKGEPGYDVFGTAITAKQGHPKQIGTGKGVRKEDDGIIYADTAGHVEWKDGTISVSPVFVVPGNVDFSIGNINFRGSVIVNRDVCEGFTVRSTDNITVEGLATRANLFCEGDIEVKNGITSASDKGFIECKGRLMTKYMVNVKADTRGDILVETQIVNSEIICAGKVIMPTGRLVGGTAIALGGLEVGEVGAQVGTRTTLVVSIDQFETAETRSIDQELKNLEEKLDKLEQLLGPFIRDRSLLNQLPPKKMEQVLEHISSMDTIQQDIQNLHEERQKSLDPYAESLSDQIIVHKMVHPGVDVRIDNSRQVFSEAISGPVIMKPNYQRGTIAIHTYKPDAG